MKKTENNRFPFELLTLPLAFLLLGVFMQLLGSPQGNHAKSWNRYYPLSRGNTWKYVIISTDHLQEFVTWRVGNLSNNSKGTIFAVWPTPAQSDDEGTQLQFTHDGLKELTDDFYVLRFPLLKGSKWKTDGHERMLTVISEGEPCAVGKHNFAKCAVIQDDDHEAKLRTLTTYALGVGPVRYEYRKLNVDEVEKQATEIMEIVSYTVKPTLPPKIGQPRSAP